MKTYPKTQCATCKRHFPSTTEFDAHRTGAYGKDRRCLSAIEMVRDNWVSFPALSIDGNRNKTPVMIWARQTTLDANVETARRFKLKSMELA